MHIFELILILMVIAVVLTAIARRVGVPYPSLLALGGIALALLPNAPTFAMDSELTLALLLAPVLLDAAYDTSIRDLKNNWIPVTSLVLVAVVLTTSAVAWVAHALVPSLPWSAAIALGAIVAPPDAAAASAVLKQLKLPHRVLVILEGESLLNDASALLLYRFAVLATVTGDLHVTQVVPAFALSLLGSCLLGYMFALLYLRIMVLVEDASSSIVLQFVGTFGIWILADRIGLSAIITVVVYAITLAQLSPRLTPAKQRVPSYAVWETAVFVLNVLAFVLIGLQVRPIVVALDASQRHEYFLVAGAVLATVVCIRIAWVMLYNSVARLKVHFFGGGRWPGSARPTVKSGLIIGWCGMRGIVTLAAAYALPVASKDSPGFPHRDLILLCAFSVVVGTLIIQGFTLRMLITSLRLRDDRKVEDEVRMTHKRIARAALQMLDDDQSTESMALRRELVSLLDEDDREDALSSGRSSHDSLRAKVIEEQRRVLAEMRTNDEIGDSAFHRVEEKLDWDELSAKGQE